MQTDHIDDLRFVRMATTLALTYGDGYVLVAIRNGDPHLTDHSHRWYEFWDRKVGRPLGEMTTRPDGAVQREFSLGTVVYNPETAHRSVTVKFPSPRISAARGMRGMSFTVAPDDGDMFIDPVATEGRNSIGAAYKSGCRS
jgi:hypothetical protein